MNDIHKIITIVDQVTHETTLVFGNRLGLFTEDDSARGGLDHYPSQLDLGIEFAAAPTGTRNVNLSLGQFYQGAVQPSQLAADITHALFYASSRDNGFPVSTSNILETGNTNW